MTGTQTVFKIIPNDQIYHNQINHKFSFLIIHTDLSLFDFVHLYSHILMS